MDIDQEHSHFDTASALVSGNHYLPDTHLKDASVTKCFWVNPHAQAFPAALRPQEQREIIQETRVGAGLSCDSRLKAYQKLMMNFFLRLSSMACPFCVSWFFKGW